METTQSTIDDEDNVENGYQLWMAKSMIMLLTKSDLQATQTAFHNNDVKKCVQVALQQQGLVTFKSGRTKNINLLSKEVFATLRPRTIQTPWFMLFSQEIQVEVKKM